MASRMPIPPSVETLSQSHPLHAEEQSAQVARAAQMQAAARAAAGLPPLDRPTATTVTTTPPTIPAPRISVSQHPGLSPPPQQQQPHHSSRPNPTSTSYAGAVPHQPQQQPSLPHQQPPQQQQLYAQSNSYGPPPPDAMARMANANQSAAAARGRTTSTTTTAAAGLGGRRFSNPALVSAAVAPPLPAPPLPPSLQPTPAPTAEEGRVSSSSILNLHAQPHMAPLVGPRIQELVRSLDPSYTIDAQAEEQVLQLADDFLDKVCKQALRMASHRGSKVLDVQDVQLVLAKQWNIVIPGLGPPISKKPKILSPAKSHGATSTGGGGANKRRATSSSAKSTTKLSKSNLGESAPTSTA